MTVEDTRDAHVDQEIASCLDLKNPKSFFLYAGAGSGKTRSLIEALLFLNQQYESYLRINRKRVAVVTYTNAACDEIKSRISYNPLFFVSTIHSFVWELIKNYQNDIREWLASSLTLDIEELQIAQHKGRSGTKAAIDRQNTIEEKTARLATINTIRQFTYSPAGTNRSKDALSHADVIKIAAAFLEHKPLMQQILIQKYPILFIDESQDTNRGLVEALFSVEKKHSGKFSLGLFGDTMQRIYPDGKADLGKDLPPGWITPQKTVNHRCANRIIRLINQIRSGIDDQKQVPKEGQTEGYIRLFITSATQHTDKNTLEEKIARQMADITKDGLWSGPSSDVKILILEHHMAARRMGFFSLFESLSKSQSLRPGLVDASLSGIRFFTQLILPIIDAQKRNDKFTVASIVKKHSPLLGEKALKGSNEQIKLLKAANDAVVSLVSLWSNDHTPDLSEIIRNVAASGLFTLPSPLSIIARRAVSGKSEKETAEETSLEHGDEPSDAVIDAWDNALHCAFTEIERYHEYTQEKSRFGTHQGVKGLEYPRVMVVLDDNDAKGFLFSYEKLLGVKSATDTDLKHLAEGKETSNDRTRRLFYVACSRAEKSLAVVAYSESPELLKSYALQQKWFEEEEILLV